MAKRTRHEKAGCPVARPLDVIGDCWSMLIVRDAFDGLRRFGEFQKSLGLAKNVLAARLHSLVDYGVLKAVPASDGSAYHEYVLTEKGEALFPVLVALRQWGERFCFKPSERYALLVDRKRGKPLRRLEVHAQDGRALESADTMVVGRPA